MVGFAVIYNYALKVCRFVYIYHHVNNETKYAC